ncbi:unnamed protein product [Brassica oleracea var. botrytis]
MTDCLIIVLLIVKTVHIWGSSEDWKYACRHILKDHSADVRAVTVHATNKYFVSASLDSSSCFYDMSSGLCFAQVRKKMGLFLLMFHLQGIMEKGSSTVCILKWET